MTQPANLSLKELRRLRDLEARYERGELEYVQKLEMVMLWCHEALYHARRAVQLIGPAK